MFVIVTNVILAYYTDEECTLPWGHPDKWKLREDEKVDVERAMGVHFEVNPRINVNDYIDRENGTITIPDSFIREIPGFKEWYDELIGTKRVYSIGVHYEAFFNKKAWRNRIAEGK